jgi:serine/threonine protein kinase
MSTTRIDSNRILSNISDPAIVDQMLQEGDRLGHCRVISLIAAGGMANVYKVWHEQLEMVRAIKILKPGFNDESRGRLETEGKISANLRHSNIVEIYGMGHWNSIPYIEMEYVDGPSLKELIGRYNRLPLCFSIAVCHFVCTALQYAFNRDMTLYGKVYDGLIHRDIKPANILITSQGKIKLADFGIARPSEASLHTVGTKVMGTFAYLSPEQLNGEKLDQRSDIYSLSAVLYEMITGVKTFPQKILAELIQKKTKGHFIPLENTGLPIPKQLCNIVEKSLSLDKNRRYFSADDFDHELMTVLRKFTSQSPDEIVRDFMKNPHTSATTRITTNRKKKGKLIWLVAIIFSALCVLYFFTGIKKEKKSQPITPEPVAADTLKTLPQTTDKTTKTVARVAKTTPPPPSQASPYERACKAFEEKEYNVAISLFEALPKDKLNSQQLETVNYNLLQMYLNKNELEKALKISLNFHSSNSSFYILLSKLFVRLKRYQEAVEALEFAGTLNNSTQTLRAIDLQKARISEARFLMKPNRDNKQLCFKAWNSFLENFCNEKANSSDCEEAKKKILQYSE